MSAQVPAGRFLSFDYVEFWVGNALQARDYYISRFGFRPYAYRGLETGSKEIVTHVVRQNDAILAFSSPLLPASKSALAREMTAHQAEHGDGVRDIAFTVDNAEAIYKAAVENGAISVREPQTLTDPELGSVKIASVKTYGDTIHTFVERSNFKGKFLPGFKVIEQDGDDPFQSFTPEVGLLNIDHIVGNQGWNEMVNICEWYEQKLGFHRFWSVDDSVIHTEYSALKSIVMTDKEENIKMPINEPAKGKKMSQIEEFVNFYGGAGAQHIALRTNDIIHAVTQMRARGVSFLPTPDSYYDNLRKRLAHAPITVKEDIDVLQKLKILVDFDDKGYLLQIFTKPVEDRPTLFYEIIQRQNNSGFGAGNFKALFESIEHEQERRGTLVDTNYTIQC
ncbi:hypothetical protein FDP41_005953 [Naegleria fowleri]|uniref:4-hydroxyphenylpyruvate dioxygenase n=1 Tax=Naegleria fowleri TaxID=5763 RepID=A0A6A5BMI3_NAEFO|nr:uncharacterized protein FDP41_005953 [Naegleria fowleri]KAF0975200.1 hypothetical protein FDP41_005953 [Naegleria fowleri]